MDLKIGQIVMLVNGSGELFRIEEITRCQNETTLKCRCQDGEEDDPKYHNFSPNQVVMYERY